MKRGLIVLVTAASLVGVPLAYAQEARSYAFGLFLSTLASLLSPRIAEVRRNLSLDADFGRGS